MMSTFGVIQTVAAGLDPQLLGIARRGSEQNTIEARRDPMHRNPARPQMSNRFRPTRETGPFSEAVPVPPRMFRTRFR